jgi:hypothetical protein
MISGNRQKSEFEKRLERIAAGGPNTMKQVYVGVADEAAPRRGRRRPSMGAASFAQVLMSPFTVLAAFVSGALAVLAVRLIRFRYLGEGLIGEDPTVAMARDALGALALVLVLRVVLRSGGWLRTPPRLLGAAAMLVGMHNLVHLAPAPFEALFSPAWVDEVVRRTTPGTLQLAGASYALPQPPAPGEEPAMPRILRLN